MAPLLAPVANGFSTATTLLTHIPKPEQRKLLMSLIKSLRTDEDYNINFVASLVQQLADHDAKQMFLTFLETAIRTGEARCAVSISLQHPELGNELLDRAAELVSKAKSTPKEDPSSDRALQSYLNFLKSTVSRLPVGNAQAKLFEACLHLLSAANEAICISARDVVFTLLSVPCEQIVNGVLWPSQQLIWEIIRALLASKENKLRTMLGYSLWLRWIISELGPRSKVLNTPQYWDLLLEGLRNGDAERRKLCLNTLKLSIATDDVAVSKDERQQYERYCTVFETIVLGRYVNQIQECEKDLDLLATESLVGTKWLYALLASGMDSNTQESNRKFIGNWAMRSSLKPTPEFMGFYRNDFLPWVTQGQLFVSTLKRNKGVLRCHHGDRLAHFIQRLLLHDSQTSQLVDITINTILRKGNSVFAYATVYLIEGLGNSIQSHHLKNLADLRGLPEVARDYVSVKTSSLNQMEHPAVAPSRRELREKSTIEKCRAFNGDAGSLDDIWSDLEYLEFPKRLLMAIPENILSAEIVQQATNDPALAVSLAEKLRSLRNISQTKTFLFAPLVCAIRKAAATTLGATVILELEDFITSIAEHPPEPTVDLLLEEAIWHLTPFSYEHYFGDRLSYGFAAFLDLLSRLHEYQGLIKTILDRVLSRWKAQKVPPPTVSAWKTTLQLQVLLLCFEQYAPPSMTETQALLADLFHILTIEPLPHYRFLIEAIIVRLFMRFDLRDALLARLKTKDHHSNPKHLASLMKIGVVLAYSKQSSEDFALQLAIAFVPMAASSKVVIRHESQWQIPLLMDHARAKEWSSIIDNPAFAALDDYIKSLERFHEPPLERQIGRFDPETECTLSNLVEGKWLGLGQTETPISSHDDFVKLYKEDLPPTAPTSCMPLGEEIERAVAPQQHDQPETSNTRPPVGPRTANEVSALQTKGTAYLARTLSDTSAQPSRPSDLIVVGSLVDNPYNLGGLSRVSEIFGASALCLQNQNVLSNKEFQSVSVSSHLHFPIVHLSASGVPGFLAARKGEGFTVVGIEQTDRSVILGSKEAQLPKKVVLVVGSEKEGIPALVLTECDTLVEIPQQGITRSLNVQTAVSIVLYEHARQHRLMI